MTTETIKHNGTTLTLAQEPYLDVVCVRVGDTVDVIDGEVYRAGATDSEHNIYQIYWTKLREASDGLEVADWDAYTVVER